MFNTQLRWSLNKNNDVWTFQLDSSYWLLHSCAICLEAFLRSVSELPLGPGASHWILRRHCVCIQDLTFQSTKNCHLEYELDQKWRADWLSWVFFPNGSSQGQADQSFWTRPAQASSRSIHVLHHILNIFEFFGNKPSRQLRSLAAALDRAEAGYRLHNRRWTSWSQRLTFDNFANLCLLFGFLDVFCFFCTSCQFREVFFAMCGVTRTVLYHVLPPVSCHGLPVRPWCTAVLEWAPWKLHRSNFVQWR